MKIFFKNCFSGDINNFWGTRYFCGNIFGWQEIFLENQKWLFSAWPEVFWPRIVGARPPAAGPWLARLLWTIWHWWGSPSWWLDNVTVLYGYILHLSSVWKLLFGKYCTEIWHDLEGRSITWFLFLHGVCLKINWGVGFIASHITSQSSSLLPIDIWYWSTDRGTGEPHTKLWELELERWTCLFDLS